VPTLPDDRVAQRSGNLLAMPAQRREQEASAILGELECLNVSSQASRLLKTSTQEGIQEMTCLTFGELYERVEALYEKMRPGYFISAKPRTSLLGIARFMLIGITEYTIAHDSSRTRGELFESPASAKILYGLFAILLELEGLEPVNEEEMQLIKGGHYTALQLEKNISIAISKREIHPDELELSDCRPGNDQQSLDLATNGTDQCLVHPSGRA
jgi:hypothetical protein